MLLAATSPLITDGSVIAPTTALLAGTVVRDNSCAEAITLTGVPFGMYPDATNTGVLTAVAELPFL